MCFGKNNNDEILIDTSEYNVSTKHNYDVNETSDSGKLKDKSLSTSISQAVFDDNAIDQAEAESQISTTLSEIFRNQEESNSSFSKYAYSLVSNVLNYSSSAFSKATKDDNKKAINNNSYQNEKKKSNGNFIVDKIYKDMDYISSIVSKFLHEPCNSSTLCSTESYSSDDLSYKSDSITDSNLFSQIKEQSNFRRQHKGSQYASYVDYFPDHNTINPAVAGISSYHHLQFDDPQQFLDCSKTKTMADISYADYLESNVLSNESKNSPGSANIKKKQNYTKKVFPIADFCTINTIDATQNELSSEFDKKYVANIDTYKKPSAPVYISNDNFNNYGCSSYNVLQREKNAFNHFNNVDSFYNSYMDDKFLIGETDCDLRKFSKNQEKKNNPSASTKESLYAKSARKSLSVFDKKGYHSQTSSKATDIWSALDSTLKHNTESQPKNYFTTDERMLSKSQPLDTDDVKLKSSLSTHMPRPNEPQLLSVSYPLNQKEETTNDPASSFKPIPSVRSNKNNLKSKSKNKSHTAIIRVTSSSFFIYELSRVLHAIRVIKKIDTVNVSNLYVLHLNCQKDTLKFIIDYCRTTECSLHIDDELILSCGAPTSDNILHKYDEPYYHKYTAKYEIQIPHDDDFNVTCKLIGTRGLNMKEIFSQTGSKLRLRGIGSGYLETKLEQEANEELNFCISNTNLHMYIITKQKINALLTDLYNNYFNHLKLKNRNPVLYKIKMKENVRNINHH